MRSARLVDSSAHARAAPREGGSGSITKASPRRSTPTALSCRIRSNRRRPSPRRCNLAVLRRCHSTTPRRFSRRFRLIWRRGAVVVVAKREQSPSVRIGRAWLSARHRCLRLWRGAGPQRASRQMPFIHGTDLRSLPHTYLLVIRARPLRFDTIRSNERSLQRSSSDDYTFFSPHIHIVGE